MSLKLERKKTHFKMLAGYTPMFTYLEIKMNLANFPSYFSLLKDFPSPHLTNPFFLIPHQITSHLSSLFPHILPLPPAHSAILLHTSPFLPHLSFLITQHSPLLSYLSPLLLHPSPLCLHTTSLLRHHSSLTSPSSSLTLSP